jgi:hypothetical protein
MIKPAPPHTLDLAREAEPLAARALREQALPEVPEWLDAQILAAAHEAAALARQNSPAPSRPWWQARWLRLGLPGMAAAMLLVAVLLPHTRVDESGVQLPEAAQPAARVASAPSMPSEAPITPARQAASAEKPASPTVENDRPAPAAMTKAQEVDKSRRDEPVKENSVAASTDAKAKDSASTTTASAGAAAAPAPPPAFVPPPELADRPAGSEAVERERRQASAKAAPTVDLMAKKDAARSADAVGAIAGGMQGNATASTMAGAPAAKPAAPPAAAPAPKQEQAPLAMSRITLPPNINECIEQLRTQLKLDRPAELDERVKRCAQANPQAVWPEDLKPLFLRK